MRHGYGYNRSERDFAHADVERVWIDTAKTDRLERADMLEIGLRPKDTLVLLRPGDLGRGPDLAAVRRLLEARGVTIEIAQQEDKRPVGAPLRFNPSPDQDKRIRELWYAQGVYLLGHVLKRAEEIYGEPVSRNQLDHRYGPRDGSMPKGRKR